MTTIGQNNGEHKPHLVRCKEPKITVEEGWSIYTAQVEGNHAQRAAATIFDFDGDGKYDSSEAWSFNHSSITHDPDKGEIRLYDIDAKPGSKPKRVVKIEEHKAEYEEKAAKYKKFAQTLTRYGIDIEMAKRAGIHECEVKTLDNGNTVLLLEGYSFTLELPIDKDFEPSTIFMGSGHFENVKGTFRFTTETLEYPNEVIFGGESNVTVVGMDGSPDKVIIQDGAKVTFTTNDYADSIIDTTRESENGDYEVIKHLKPGTTTVTGAERDETKGEKEEENT